MKNNEKKRALAALQAATENLDLCTSDGAAARHCVDDAIFNIIFGLLPENIQQWVDEDGWIVFPSPVEGLHELDRDGVQAAESDASLEMQNDLFDLVYNALGYTSADDTEPESNSYVPALQAVYWELGNRMWPVLVNA